MHAKGRRSGQKDVGPGVPSRPAVMIKSMSVFRGEEEDGLRAYLSWIYGREVSYVSGYAARAFDVQLVDVALVQHICGFGW